MEDFVSRSGPGFDGMQQLHPRPGWETEAAADPAEAADMPGPASRLYGACSVETYRAAGALPYPDAPDGHGDHDIEDGPDGSEDPVGRVEPGLLERGIPRTGRGPRTDQLPHRA